MIAVWMAYTLACGTLIAFACWLLERIAGAARIPTRGVWAGGMMMMLVFAAAAAVHEHSWRPASLPSAPGTLIHVSVEGSDGSAALIPAALAHQRLSRAGETLNAWIATAAVRLARWDRPLLVLWAVAAAFMGGIVAHATLEGMRLRYGLETQNVAGTTVLLTNDVGPSAIGVGRSAILVPRWALDLDGPQMTLLLRHEREHLAARDPLLLLASLLSLVLAPWHLPLWWSRKRLLMAVEVDCDRRVLRAHPDVRRYGQLLLLAAQRPQRPAWPNHAVASVVAPLRPRARQLATRISAMTQPHKSRILLRAIPLAIGVVAIATLLITLPSPGGVQAQVQGSGAQERAIVHLTEVGWLGVGDSPPSIVIYTTEGGRVGVGTDLPAALADTLRLNRVPAITADVTDGDVHIQVRGPGNVRVGGTVTGAPAQALSATGRHIVLVKGGSGVVSMER